MAVITKYVVERNGVEKMTFTSKADADAYDKMLDMADELFVLLEQSALLTDETQCEELSLYLAEKREDILQALGAKRKATEKKPHNKSTSEQSDEITSTQDEAA